MPDSILFEKAGLRQLSDPKVLKEKVAHLLRDRRSERFVTQFTNQCAPSKNESSGQSRGSMFQSITFPTALRS